MTTAQDSGDAHRLILYYSGAAPDDKGRYLTEIQQWPDERLEIVHDFIQWMFPLEERGLNPNAPVLERSSIAEFRSRPELQQNLRASFLRLLSFYGLAVHPGPNLIIERAPNFAERAQNWLKPGNHNHLRMTRIIKSLRLLGLEPEADAFFSCLARIYDHEKDKPQPAISQETFWFWQTAADDVRC